jgi:hypothetical protein
VTNLVPPWAARTIRPVGSIGGSIWIASKFVFWDTPKDHILAILARFGLGPRARNERAAEERDENDALKLLGLDGVLAQLNKLRPPQDPREKLAVNEEDFYLRVARLIAGGVVTDYRNAQKDAPPAQLATRNQHAKQHGCVRACFIVDDQLPDDLAVGVFRRGARYDAVLRFSNAHGTPQHDRKGDARGLAIKLKTPDGQRPEQDFVLVNYPVFFLDDIPEYTQFMEIVTGKSGQLVMLVRLVCFFAPRRLRKLFIFLSMRFSYARNPLNTSYHSMTAYALGEHVVRYVVAPEGEGPAGDTPKTPNFLRERLAERLDLRDTTVSGFPNVLDFSVQIRAAPVPYDVEHASRAWRRSADRTVRLARIQIAHQKFDTADDLCDCENLQFSPWHALPEHRPLGGLNRIRLLVYIASSRMRRRLNLVDSK